MKTYLIIFGVSGDLAKRKLLPALTRLRGAGRLSDEVTVIGTARRELDRGKLLDEAGSRDLEDRFWLRRLDSGQSDDLSGLAREIVADAGGQPYGTLIYASVPPAATAGVMAAVSASGLAAPAGGPVRLMLEKPFGFDLASSRALDAELRRVFEEDQIYRIDHYLEKAALDGLVPGGQAGLLDGLVPAAVERIELEALEALAIEGRGDFYDATGALRDIIQSHLINLAAVVLAAPPADDSAAATSAARLKALRSVVTPEDVARQARRGQYAGYRDDVGEAGSHTETYAELTLFASDGALAGVPIILRTGKAMARKRTEIRVYGGGAAADGSTSRVLELASDGYEQVLDDAIGGRRHNFLSAAEIAEAWRIVEPVLKAWSDTGDDLIAYPKGSESVDG